MNEVTLPPLATAQEESWSGLLDVAERVPTGWCLIGGQLVHLHCWERDAAPNRPTNDVDTVLDVRTTPKILKTFTSALLDLGFSPDGESWEGHQHRWTREKATIDVLIATNLGEQAGSRKGVMGGTTLETPGGQAALDRSERVTIILGNRKGIINQPNLLGAILVKSAAYTIG